MPSSPIQIRLATTDINEFATWTTKNGFTNFDTLDSLYSGLTYTQIQNPIPRVFDYFKTLSGVSQLRQNESASSSTGGGHFLGGTASLVENPLLGITVGAVNKININSLVSQFMVARNQGGLTLSLIVNGKQDTLTPIAPVFTESDYVVGAAAGAVFDANTFYKTSNWISFHSREAAPADIPSIVDTTSISFRKSFHHGFISVNNSQVAGISQSAGGASIRSIGTFDWNKVQGLSANCQCIFAQRTTPTNESISTQRAASNTPQTITASNKTLTFTGVVGTDAIFTNTTSTTLFNAAIPNQLVPARINWGDPGYSTKVGGTSQIYSISTTAPIPTLIIRPQYAPSYGTKNYVAISLQSAANTRFFGGTTNLGITVGSYIRISSSTNSTSNSGIYQVVSIQDGIPNDTNENNSLGTNLPPFQYLELSRDIVPEEAGARITIENVSKLPILHIKYTKVISN